MSVVEKRKSAAAAGRIGVAAPPDRPWLMSIPEADLGWATTGTADPEEECAKPRTHDSRPAAATTNRKGAQ
jgi:hypothetical protein